jgi:hypothetical protein
VGPAPSVPPKFTRTLKFCAGATLVDIAATTIAVTSGAANPQPHCLFIPPPSILSLASPVRLLPVKPAPNFLEVMSHAFERLQHNQSKSNSMAESTPAQADAV